MRYCCAVVGVGRVLSGCGCEEDDGGDGGGRREGRKEDGAEQRSRVAARRAQSYLLYAD